MPNKILYWTPRILALLFVAFLCLFSLDSFTEATGWTAIKLLFVHLLIPAIVLVATIIAWKKALWGSIIFSVLAVYYVWLVGLDRHWSWYLTISGPALLTAFLFFLSWRYNK